MPYRKPAAAIVVMAAVYLAGMFLATHLPIDVQAEATGLDKLAHFAMYGALAVLLSSSARLFWPTSAMTVGGVMLVVAFYGALDEWTQPYVGRTADFWDWVADVGGAVCGALLFVVARRIVDSRPAAGS